MRANPKTIPTSFVRLDSTVKNADRFADAYIQNVMRKNHNILLAKRCKRVVFAKSFHTVSGGLGTAFTGLHNADGSLGGVPISVIFRSSSPYCSYVTLNMYASGDATDIPVIYPVVHAVDSRPKIIDPTVKYSFNSASLGWCQVSVPVPLEIRNMELKRLTLLTQVGEGTGATKTAGTVYAVGEDWASVTSAFAGQVGDFVYSSVTGVLTREIKSIQTITTTDSGTDTTTVDLIKITEPWNLWPTVGSTLTPRSVVSITMESLIIEETDESTFFDAFQYEL